MWTAALKTLFKNPMILMAIIISVLGLMLYKSHSTIIEVRLQRDQAQATLDGIQKQTVINNKIIEEARRQREEFADDYRQAVQQLEAAANDCGNSNINDDYIIMFDTQFSD